MNTKREMSFRWDWLGGIMVAVMVYACANRGYPEGGPKDLTSPEVTAEVPLSYSLNFDKKRINIYFNEFVQLKDIEQKFIISPPQKKKPKVRLKGKYIQVEFSDSLKPNTTYSLDFADAIVDNNEGNPLGYYRYVFSTGNTIDTLELSGNVVNAESGEPMLNVYVELYSNLADSIPLLEVPDYVARTDSSGFFRLTNLKDTVYRVIAVEDKNRDYKYTPEGEMFAFIDTMVRPIVMPFVRTDTFKIIERIVERDTITSDSIVTSEYLLFGPNNLYLRLFQEELTQLYMVDDGRKEREKLNFTFSIPARNDFKIQLWDTLATGPLPTDWYITERSAGNDTLTLWIKDSTVYKRDTLTAILTYLRTDSTGQRVMYADTSRYTFHDKKVKEDNNRHKKKEDDKVPKIEFLEVKPNVGSELDLGGHLWLEFNRPIDKSGLDSLKLMEKVDTLYQPVKFTLQEDSLKIRRIYIDADWKPGQEYQLSLDSASVYDLYGHHNNKLEKKFKVRTEEYYGKIMLQMKGVQGDVIVQLYKSDNTKSENGIRKYAIVQEKKVNRDGEVVFSLIPEGKYKFRAILDTNGNGKWDTGLYLKGRQPEEIIYLPVEMTVRQNFDIEQEFNLKGTYNGEK